MEVTAVEVSVSFLIMKLRNFVAEGAGHPGFRRRATKSIKNLEELQELFSGEEETKPDLSIKLVQLLRDLYSFNNTIDEVLFNSMLDRGLLKRMPTCGLIPPFSEIDRAASNLKRWRGEPPLIQRRPSVSKGSPEALPSHGDTFTKRLSAQMSDDIVGMDDQVEMLEYLVRGSHKLPFIIQITGIPGSGKTTLARKIFNMLHIKQRFECCAWINVSREVEERMVLMEALRQITVIEEGGGLSLDCLLRKVQESLEKKRYLIVLDDVHSSDTWKNLRRALLYQLNGSRLILITQDVTKLGQIPVQWSWTIKMRPLNREENCKLFVKEMEPNEGPRCATNDLMEILFKICEGIPLKVIFLAGQLAKGSHHQLSIQNELDNIVKKISAPWDLLTAGYLELPASTKGCLLYMGLFPKSYEVPVRRLIRLWIAEGLAVPDEGSKNLEPEDVAEKQFKKLVKRNMIEVATWRSDGSPKTCRVPGILHEILFPGAANMGFLHVHHGSDVDNLKPEFNFQRLAEYADVSKKSESYYLQDIRSYISFCKRKGDDRADEARGLLDKFSARRGFGLLTVLDLERLYKPNLPDTLGKLLLLKYLGLRYTYLEEVPGSVCKLLNLETLDVKHTNITLLPILFWKAKKLRHLHMNDNIQLDIPRASLSKHVPLPNLKTLTGLFVGRNSSMMIWLEKLHCLDKLGLTCHVSSVNEIMQSICKLKTLQSLTVTSIDDSGRPSDIDLGRLEHHTKLNELYLVAKLPSIVGLLYLPKDLKSLTLSCSELKADPMRILGKTLCSLNILGLFARSYRGEKMTCLRGGFPELRVLRLWMLEELKEWTLEDGALPSLSVLEIRCCNRLKHTYGLQKVASLKELILTNMPDDFSDDVKAINRRKRVFVKKRTFDFASLPKYSKEA